MLDKEGRQDPPDKQPKVGDEFYDDGGELQTVEELIEDKGDGTFVVSAEDDDYTIQWNAPKNQWEEVDAEIE